MGMPCEINTILKLKPSQGFPEELELSARYQVFKEGYRIFPVDVPIFLVDESWVTHADVIINKLVWEKNQTIINFEIRKIYSSPFSVE
jgi:hypothetical protein